MQFAALLALSATVSAAPSLWGLTSYAKAVDDSLPSCSSSTTCIPYTTALEIQQQFISTLTAYNSAVASNLLSPNLVDYSASINFLAKGGANANLSAPTFPNAQAYMAGQGSQPAINMTILSTDAITCDGTIVFRWVAGVGTGRLPAHGMTILKAVQSGQLVMVGPQGWQLGSIFTEFNSAAWIMDIGGNVTMPARNASGGS
jgi:hypothetical protein